jgi:hypothetical protein
MHIETVCPRVVARFSPGILDHSISITNNNHEVKIAGLSYLFDAVEKDIDQETLFQKHVQSSVECVLSGTNASVLCYGYTGTGKTFTSFGTEDCPGIVQRCCEQMLAVATCVKVSIVEVYLERLFDLVGGGNVSVSSIGLRGATAKQIQTPWDLQVLLRNMNRKTHEKSSRSHCVVVFGCTIDNQFAELYVADLAGCERLGDQEGNSEIHLRQSQTINKSVFAINSVVKACANYSRTTRGHIPYRDSKITMLLRRALGGNSQVLVLLCCSSMAVADTQRTLRFGQRCRQVKNRVVHVCNQTIPEQNIAPDNTERAYEVIIRGLEEEIAELRQALSNLMEARGQELSQEVEKLRETGKELVEVKNIFQKMKTDMEDAYVKDTQEECVEDTQEENAFIEQADECVEDTQEDCVEDTQEENAFIEQAVEECEEDTKNEFIEQAKEECVEKIEEEGVEKIEEESVEKIEEMRVINERKLSLKKLESQILEKNGCCSFFSKNK